MPDPYAHWNEGAPIIKARENDPESPYCDMSDDEIKQAVYDRMMNEDPYEEER